MSSRFFQLQTEAAHTSRSSSPKPHRPHPTATQGYHSRASTSSDSSSSSSSSSYSSSYTEPQRYTSSYTEPQRYSMDSSVQPRVEVLRCSRCAKCVETIVTSRGGEDASSSGMVKFGHNLYYCDRCARMVGYK